jgi:hypothetical protein
MEEFEQPILYFYRTDCLVHKHQCVVASDTSPFKARAYLFCHFTAWHESHIGVFVVNRNGFRNEEEPVVVLIRSSFLHLSLLLHPDVWLIAVPEDQVERASTLANMTEEEFETLDQLYFVTSYEELQKSLLLNEFDLRKTIMGMYKKGWVKCFNLDHELINMTHKQIEENFQSLSFLATKAWLMAHNQR